MSENSSFAVFCMIFCQTTSFVRIGIGLVFLNPSAPALLTFINNTYEARYNVTMDEGTSNVILALFQSSYDFGALIGAILIHFCVKYLSRRKSVALPHVMWLFSTILMIPVAMGVSSYEAIICGRVISGIARGIAFSAVPLYVSETTNRKNLAFFQGMLAWLVEGGLIAGAAVGHPNLLGNVEKLPYLFAFPAIFSIIFFIFYPFIPETPCYLIINEIEDVEYEKVPLLKSNYKRDPTSYQLLHRLRKGTEAEIFDEYQTIKAEIETDLSTKTATFRDFIQVPHYWKQLIASIAIVTGAQFTAISIVLYYSDQIFVFVGLSEFEASNCTLGLLILVFLCTIISVFIVNKLGAKKLYLYGGLMVIPGLLLLMITTLDYWHIPYAPYLNICGSMLIILGFTGPKQSLSIYPSELTTYITRPKVLWFSSIGYYTIAIIVSFLTPVMIKHIQGLAYLPWIICFILVLIYIKCKVPDTHLRPIAEIQDELRGYSTSIYNIIEDK